MQRRLMKIPFFCVLAAVFPLSIQAADTHPEVIVQSAEVHTLQNRIEALGSLRANESIRLTSSVTKTVVNIHFDDGQRIHKDDLLVEMASAEEQALLAEAEIHAAEAKKQLERVKSLVASRAASQSLLDQRLREYESARARHLAIKARLNDLQLLAPFDGVVGLRNISVGALVSPGELITTLNDDSKMKLDFTVPAVYLQSLQVGLPIIARSKALADKLFEGEIFSIDNQVDPVTRAITVRALLPNPDAELKQGMLMSVELYSNKRQALVVSESALVPFGSSNFVFVVSPQDDESIVERRAVIIGQRLHGEVEILSGLDEHEKVVTHGLQRIRDGSIVNVLAEGTGKESLSELINTSNDEGN